MPGMIDIKSTRSWHQKLLQGRVGSLAEGVKSLLLIAVFDPSCGFGRRVELGLGIHKQLEYLLPWRRPSGLLQGSRRQAPA